MSITFKWEINYCFDCSVQELHTHTCACTHAHAYIMYIYTCACKHAHTNTGMSTTETVSREDHCLFNFIVLMYTRSYVLT